MEASLIIVNPEKAHLLVVPGVVDTDNATVLIAASQGLSAVGLDHVES